MAKWVKGQSGNPAGRPKGSRHVLTEAVFKEFAAHWREHGVEAIDTLFQTRPDLYVQAAIRLIPQNIEVEAVEVRRSAVQYDTSELIAMLGEDPEANKPKAIPQDVPVVLEAEGASPSQPVLTGPVEPDGS